MEAERGKLALASALVLALLLLAGCDLGGDDEPGAASAPAQGEPMDLDVLVYNIEYGGGPETDRVIRRLDADVVGVLESYERLPEIAERTGYPYYNTSLQLLSKYPILEPSGGDGLYALLEVEPGYAIPFFNVHLDYVEWGPRALANGASVASVIESEDEVRTSAMEQPIEAMTELIDGGYPVFLTGDFNQPSSLDYGADTVGTRKGIEEPVPWPVSEELFGLGFRDTYREMHPDPVRDPGITQDRTGERIDYVYAAGPSTTLDSELVGEPGGAGRGDRGGAVDLRPPRRAVELRGDARCDAHPDRGRRAPANRRRRDHGRPQRAGVGRQRDRRRARGRRSRRSDRDVCAPPTNAERRRSTHAAGTPAATTPSWPTATATRPLASRSTSAIRRLGSSCRPTRTTTSAASRSRSRGLGRPPTAGTGSGSTRRTPRTPRWTTT